MNRLNLKCRSELLSKRFKQLPRTVHPRKKYEFEHG